MRKYFNISGELTQKLLTAGDNYKLSKISLTNIQKVSKCKVDLYVEKKLTGKFYILKNIELPIGVTLEHDFSINNFQEEFSLYIKLTDGATFTITGSIDPIASTTVTGVNTSFLSEVSIGDEIVVSGETKTVSNIASDTSLTISSAFSDNGNDTSPDCNPTALVDIILS
jgi:hypothetical protein